MCRLLGVASAEPTSVADVVGEAVLTDFLALTKIHGDGWGVASAIEPDDVPRVEVSPDSAIGDPRFGTAVKESARASLVHLRWATNGLAVRPENSHPFGADGLAMAHNGSIKPIAALDQLLDPSMVAALQGTTDSERYFALIRQHRPTAPDLAEAVRRAVAQLRGIYPDASLNALVLGRVDSSRCTRMPEVCCWTRTSKRSAQPIYRPSISRTTSRCALPGSTTGRWSSVPPDSAICRGCRCPEAWRRSCSTICR